jgi:hypothetical protein
VTLGMRAYTMKYFNMKNKLQDIAYFLIVLILIGIIAYQGQTIQDYKNEKSMIPGGDIYKAELQDSVRELKITVQRYELALDFLRDKDSVAANKFENELYTIE